MREPRVPQETNIRVFDGRPSTVNCTESWQTVDADHFSFASADTFPIRYFTYSAYWAGPGSPIWFYAGNEANVEK